MKYETKMQGKTTQSYTCIFDMSKKGTLVWVSSFSSKQWSMSFKRGNSHMARLINTRVDYYLLTLNILLLFVTTINCQ